MEVKIEHSEGLAECKKMLTLAKIGKKNGCLIEGNIENSIVGRGCTIGKGCVIKNCVISTDVVVADGTHLENLIVDKHARVLHAKEIVCDAANPGYVKRGDTI